MQFIIRFTFPIVLIFLTGNCVAIACLSITDAINFPNPSINASLTIQPDVSPFTKCWTGTLKIRSSKNNFRLVASRFGPNPAIQNGPVADNLMASDVSLSFDLKSAGQAPPNGALLVSPFTNETTLSSIQSGTFILSGLKKSSNSCSTHNPNFYKLTKSICLFQDFVFNPGEYNGQVIYLLIAP